MAITGTFQQIVKIDGVIYVNETVTESADGVDTRILSITGPATNQLVAFTLDVSQSQLFSITCDTAATVKTNSSGAPDKTLSLTADNPVTWKTGDGAGNHPMGTVDVTSLYVTVAATGSFTLTIVSLVDT